jgi:alpha-ketoglutarate-dependent taurine dioxygenase
MTAASLGHSCSVAASANSIFDLADEAAYRRWRDIKLQRQPREIDDLMVDVHDPRHLSAAERRAILQRCQNANMAIYRSPSTAADKELPRRLGAQLGLQRLDANWLADEDGISRITVGSSSTENGSAGAAYIPYTDRAIKWHTDGYYHPRERRIQSMILHCVNAAVEGGRNALMDHEMAYIALRDANPRWVRALMADDAMTIPARMGEAGVARAAQSGPVFSVDPGSGALHMRYTARTRSVEWKADACTRDAVAFLQELLASDVPYRFHVQLRPGMGLVGHNVLHDRSAFLDDPLQPRLLFRARYLDRIAVPSDAPG